LNISAPGNNADVSIVVGVDAGGGDDVELLPLNGFDFCCCFCCCCKPA
jgi:hypothetical protein